MTADYHYNFAYLILYTTIS